MSSEIAIKVENLSKCYQIYETPRDRLKQFVMPQIQRLMATPAKQYYREFWALKDNSFEVKKGETVGIIGRNGSGKSTLLQMICGTLNPTSGSIRTNGRIAALLELGSGFNHEFTGRENVYLNCALLGLSTKEIDNRFEEIAAFADIGEYLDQPVKTYSSGMYVRLAFAVIIHVQPEILIVDEALAVGDIRFQLKCQRKLDDLRNEGVTVLFVSHSSSDIVRLCTRAIWLDSGRIRQVGEPKNVVEEYLAWMVHDTNVIQPPTSDRYGDATTNHWDALLLPLPRDAFITGDGGAEIISVGMFSESDKRLTTIAGTEKINVVLKVLTNTRIEQPYFAFQVVNEKGLRVMGSNNHVLGVNFDPIDRNCTIIIRFCFDFPEIENGQYLLAVGVADGTPDNHIRHQFVADAYEFRIMSTSLFQQQSVLLKLHDCVVDLEIMAG